MSDDIDIAEPPSSEKADRARTRRRWLTLAEIVAVIGVAIAGLNLYANWVDRRDQAAEHSAEQSSEARDKARVELVGTVERDGRSLKLTDARHDLSEAVIVFPTSLGIATQRPPGDPAIEADWFATPLLTLTDGGSDDRTGRLPVLVTTRYFVGDNPQTATAIYDIIWRTSGRWLRGRTLRIEGMKLRQRGGTQKTLDAAWARLTPKR